MGIAVLQPAARQQIAGLDQPVHHRAIGGAELAGLLALGLQHLQAGEQGHVRVIGAVGIDRLGDLAMAVRQPQHIVVLAMARRGVDKAGAGVVGDVVAGQQGHGEAIALVQGRQGVGADHALRVDPLLATPGGDLGRPAHVLGQVVGHDQLVARLGPGLERQVGLHGLDHIDRVGDVGIIRDGPVGGHGPGGGGPDHHAGAQCRVGALHHRELHPDGGADMVVIFDLGVSQGRALHRAPHHRLGAAIELVGLHEAVELLDDLGLAGEVHGRIATGPVAQHAQALELAALDLDPVGGVVAAAGAELGLGDLVLAPALGAELLLDLPFDRQAVAVPTGDVVHVIAQQEARADHEVLEDLVQRMADMDRAIGVGRAVVEHEQGRAGVLAGLSDGLVEPGLGPLGQDLRLQLGQAGAHGERGFGKKDGFAIVAGGGFAGGIGRHDRIQ